MFFVNFPLEDNLIDTLDAFGGNLHLVYKKLFGEYADSHPIKVFDKDIAVTYHRMGEKMIVVFINHSDKARKAEYSLDGGWEIKRTLYGSTDDIKPYDACVLEISLSE